MDRAFSLFGDLPTFVLVDSNSRIGTVNSTSIGSLYADRENSHGQHFHEWLQRHRLWVPATFEACHSGDGATWAHPTGAMARLDYVAVPLSIAQYGVKSWVSDTIDISVSRVDHLAVCADVILTVQSMTQPSRPHANQPLSGPSQLQFPEVSWDTDIHHHANQLEDALLGFQRQGKRRVATLRKKHLQEGTWNLILAKKTCWQQLRRLGLHYRRGVAREIFNRWRGSSNPNIGHRHQHDDFRPWLRWVDREVAIRWTLHQRLAKQSSQAVRQDDVAYYQALAERAGKTDSEKGLQGIWKEIKAVLKRKNNTRCRQPPLEALVHHFHTGSRGTHPILIAGATMQFGSAGTCHGRLEC